MVKKLSIVLIIQLISFASYLTPFLFFNNNFSLETNAENGISKYRINQSVTYDVRINFTLTSYVFNSNYYVIFPRIDNRVPNSSLFQFCPPYQESTLKYNYISGYTTLNSEYRDKYNNTYDQFNTTLSYGQQIKVDQHYELKVDEIIFDSIKEGDIGKYDPSNYIFDLYCNTSESFYNISDPDLITASNNIVNHNDNPVEKAKKIHEWVNNYLEYEEQEGEQKGASWAYDNQKGDCSEFSSLMITLLRIQGIPARKVVGTMISLDPDFIPVIGNNWNYIWDNSEAVNPNFKELSVHAWVEYYVPKIGWIACDPTWEGDGDNYFNRMDFLRLTISIGENFTFPCIGGYSTSVIATPIFYPYYGISSLFEYKIKIAVIRTNLIFPIKWIIAIIVGLVIGVSFLIFGITKLIKKMKAVRVKETDDYIIIK